MGVTAYETHLDSDLARIFLQEYPHYTDHDGHVNRMYDISSAVGGIGLAHVRDGYEMYALVTEIVYDRLKQFEDPDKIETTIPVFAKTAEDALLSFVLGECDKIPPPWMELYKPSGLTAHGPHNRPPTPFSNLQGFWAAHIPWDLKFVLERTQTQERHRADYNRVNEMLHDAATDIMQKRLHVPRTLGRIGVNVVMRDVEKMRDRAFDDGLLLQAAGSDQQKRRAVLDTPRRQGISEHPVTRRVLDMTVRAFDELYRGVDRPDITQNVA